MSLWLVSKMFKLILPFSVGRHGDWMTSYLRYITPHIVWLVVHHRWCDIVAWPTPVTIGWRCDGQHISRVFTSFRTVSCECNYSKYVQQNISVIMHSCVYVQAVWLMFIKVYKHTLTLMRRINSTMRVCCFDWSPLTRCLMIKYYIYNMLVLHLISSLLFMCTCVVVYEHCLSHFIYIYACVCGAISIRFTQHRLHKQLLH
jgi:hypothetical protein